jgi:hypothetical protein
MCIYIFTHYWRGHSCGFTESPNDDPPHLHCTSFLKAESFSSSIFTTFLGVARFHEDACACCWKMYLLVKNCSIPVPSSIYLFIDLFIHSFIYIYPIYICGWYIHQTLQNLQRFRAIWKHHSSCQLGLIHPSEGPIRKTLVLRRLVARVWLMWLGYFKPNNIWYHIILIIIYLWWYCNMGTG